MIIFFVFPVAEEGESADEVEGSGGSEVDMEGTQTETGVPEGEADIMLAPTSDSAHAPKSSAKGEVAAESAEQAPLAAAVLEGSGGGAATVEGVKDNNTSTVSTLDNPRDTVAAGDVSVGVDFEVAEVVSTSTGPGFEGPSYAAPAPPLEANFGDNSGAAAVEATGNDIVGQSDAVVSSVESAREDVSGSCSVRKDSATAPLEQNEDDAGAATKSPGLVTLPPTQQKLELEGSASEDRQDIFSAGGSSVVSPTEGSSTRRWKLERLGRDGDIMNFKLRVDLEGKSIYLSVCCFRKTFRMNFWMYPNDLHHSHPMQVRVRRRR